MNKPKYSIWTKTIKNVSNLHNFLNQFLLCVSVDNCWNFNEKAVSKKYST